LHAGLGLYNSPFDVANEVNCLFVLDSFLAALTLAEARKRKVDIATEATKQQKLLQAEQPRAIECAV